MSHRVEACLQQLAPSKVPLFLGFDLSTQGLKAIVIDEKGNVVRETGLSFEKDLPHYHTENGICKDTSDGGLTVTAPSLMFVEALDRLLTMLHSQLPLNQIVAVSCSGQQHGSVYWQEGSRKILREMNSSLSLVQALQGAFSKPNGPIWMDSSTSVDCKRIEEEVGGAQAVAMISGSRAYERFTGPQLSKFVRTARETFSRTERISLISSLIPSLLLGDYAPIDASDAGGMNLCDLKEMQWSPTLMVATVGAGEAQHLREKLGQVALSHSVCGTVHSYFTEKFGFDPACQVICGTGDNPSSAVGLQLTQEGDVAISLGTSDTLLAIVPKEHVRPGLEGHFFANPTDPDTCLAMLCWKNGSVTRERIRVSTGVADWNHANELVENHSQPGNGGLMGIFILEPEITPHVLTTQIARFGPNDEKLAEFESAAMELRAVLESQVLAMRSHSANLGLQRPKRILVTGGASVNPVVRQLIADVFDCPVFVSLAGPNSASLGAAFRALHGHACHARGTLVGLSELVSSQQQLAAEPRAEVVSLYGSLCTRYAKLEGLLAK